MEGYIKKIAHYVKEENVTFSQPAKCAFMRFGKTFLPKLWAGMGGSVLSLCLTLVYVITI